MAALEQADRKPLRPDTLPCCQLGLGRQRQQCGLAAASRAAASWRANRLNERRSTKVEWNVQCRLTGEHFEKIIVGNGPLCTSLHKDTYAQFPVMNSLASVVLAVTSVKGQTRGLCPLHNYRFFKNSRSDSVALKRRAGTPGSCRRARAFSFMAKSASTY